MSLCLTIGDRFVRNNGTDGTSVYKTLSPTHTTHLYTPVHTLIVHTCIPTIQGVIIYLFTVIYIGYFP